MGRSDAYSFKMKTFKKLPEGYPVVWGFAHNVVSQHGGALITIEGENFGSVLSSFGEEGRDTNTEISINFVGSNDPFAHHGSGKRETLIMFSYHYFLCLYIFYIAK